MKQQRKSRIALFGAIAAVAAAIGGGWAVHVALSYQDNSNTATDGGVVNRDIQGSPVTHTGSGDINQGIQIRTKGPGKTHIEGGVHQHIGITLGEYEAGLKRREQEVTEELQQAHARDRQVLEKEQAEIARRLADTHASYQSYVKELEERIAHLERIRGQVPDALLEQARDALAQGDRSQADQLFARIEAQNEAAVQATAEAAYQRSRIALDEIRYREADAHARRAAQLAPENSLYLAGAGELAQILGDYGAARDYYAQALASVLKTYGEGHPHVATIRNNLGSAWESLGEYQKAIGYYAQALASGLKTYGEDHPKVALRRNNLGSAWKALGEYQKAIGYFEQALAVFERKLGPEHPYTRGVRGNLATARAEHKP